MHKKTKNIFIFFSKIIILVLLILIQIILIKKAILFFLYLFFLFLSFVLLNDILKINNKISKEILFDNFEKKYILPKKSLLLLSLIILSIILIIYFKFFLYKELYYIPLILQFIIILTGILTVTTKLKISFLGQKVQQKENFFDIYFYIILLIGILNRFILLEENPPGIYGEERLFLWKSYEILNNSFRPSVYEPRLEWQVGTPIFYIIAFLFKIFGINLISFKLLPTISSILAIIFFYFFLRIFFNKNISFIGALFYIFDHSFLHISRWTHIFQLTPMFLWSALFFVVAGYKINNVFFILLGGGITGFSLYFYNANKILPFILFFYIIFDLMIKILIEKKEINLSIEIKKIIALILGLLIVFLPLLFYIFENFKEYFRHINDVSNKNFNLIIYNLIAYLKMFTVKASSFSMQNFSNRPLLATIPSFLFLFGVGKAIVTINKRESFLALLILILGVLPGGLSTILGGLPFIQRAILSFSVYCLFITIGIEFFYNAFKKYNLKILNYTFIIFLLFNFFNETRIYFVEMANNNEHKLGFSALEKDVYKICKDNYKDYDIYIGRYFNGGTNGTKDFIGKEIYFVGKIKFPEIIDKEINFLEALELFKYSEKPIMLILNSFYKYSLDYIKKRYPNAKIEIIESDYKKTNIGIGLEPLLPDPFDDNIKFIIIKIPKTDILNLKFLKYKTLSEKEYIFSFSENPQQIKEPGVLSGGLKIFKNAKYKFKFENFLLKEFFLNNKKYKIKNGETEEINLYTGIYLIELKLANINGNEKIYIKDNFNNQYQLIEDRILWIKKTNAIKGVYYNIKGEIIREEIVPAIYHRWLAGTIPGRDNIMEVKWAGKIKINKDSNFQFGLDGIHQYASIKVNNVEIFKIDLEKDKKFKRNIFLKKGIYDIIINIKQCHIGNWTILYMIMDDKKLYPVPEEYFILEE